MCAHTVYTYRQVQAVGVAAVHIPDIGPAGQQGFHDRQVAVVGGDEQRSALQGALSAIGLLGRWLV